MSIFDELQTSLKEAVSIKHGKTQAARSTRHEVADVKAIRAKLHVSQAEFAKAMGTSVDTVKSWETKRRNPTGLAAKVLATIQDDPAYFSELSSHCVVQVRFPGDRFQICPGFIGCPVCPGPGYHRPRIQIPHQVFNTAIGRKTRRCRFKNRQHFLTIKRLAGVLQLPDGIRHLRPGHTHFTSHHNARVCRALWVVTNQQLFK